MREVPVLIVGAGPTGLLLAIELARRSVPFRLIDRLERPLSWDRATVVKARSLEVLDAVCSADDFVASGQVVRAVALYSNGRRVAAFEFDGVDSPYRYMLSLPESETERILIEKLAGFGGEVERGLELVALEQDAERVRVRLRRSADGAEDLQDANWVVGTDGLHSAVREAVADAFEGHDNPTLWGVVDAHVAGWTHPINEIAAQLEPPAVNPIPLRDGRWRIYFRPEARDEGVLAKIDEGLSLMSPGAALGEHDQPQFFHTHSRVARRFRVGRVLVAGDAAHACSPIQAHGMNSGIQDTFNLGWKLALVASGQARPELLDSYEAERRPIAELVVRSSDQAEARYAAQDPDARKALVAELATAEGRLRAAVGESEITHGYGKSPIAREEGAFDVSDGRVTPLGHRVGDAERLRRQGNPCRLHELIRSRGHAVFVMLGEAGPEAIDEGLRLATTAAERHRPQLTAYVAARRVDGRSDAMLIGDPEGLLHRRLSAGKPGLCVVRPDGHLGLRCEPPSLDRLDAYFARMLVKPNVGADC